MAVPQNEFDGAQTEPRTDWVAWSLQLVFGMFAGSGVGFIIARWLFRAALSSFDQMLLVGAGSALCAGAFTSFHGNRAWMMSSVFDAPEPAPTQKARNISLIIGTIGAALILLPMILHVFNIGRPAHPPASTGVQSFVLHNGHLEPVPESPKSSSTDLKIFLLVLAAIPGFLVVRALRTGTGFWRFGTVDRYDTPLNFWFYVMLNAFAVICILSTMLR